MGRINKSTKDIGDIIKPITLIISEALWDKFKILATTKSLTLNDYLVALINQEVATKKDALILMQQ